MVTLLCRLPPYRTWVPIPHHFPLGTVPIPGEVELITYSTPLAFTVPPHPTTPYIYGFRSLVAVAGRCQWSRSWSWVWSQSLDLVAVAVEPVEGDLGRSFWAPILKGSLRFCIESGRVK